MKSLYTNQIEEKGLAQYLLQVNMSNRDKEIVTLYLNNDIAYRDIGIWYEISGKRIRQIIEKFARKAYHHHMKSVTKM